MNNIPTRVFTVELSMDFNIKQRKKPFTQKNNQWKLVSIYHP